MKRERAVSGWSSLFRKVPWYEPTIGRVNGVTALSINAVKRVRRGDV